MGLDDMDWRERGVRKLSQVLICAAVKMELSSTDMVRVIGRAGFGGKNRNFENLRNRQVEVSVGRGISESEVKRKIWTV